MNNILKNIVFRIIKLVSFITFVIGFAFYFALVVGKNKDKTKQKYVIYYKLMIHWVEIMMQGSHLDEYFKKTKIRNIAIYGNGDMGKLLIKCLSKTDISVNYLIDKCPTPVDKSYIPVYRPDDRLPFVDAIIVTPVCDYENIKSMMSKHINSVIISLDDVLKGISNG